MSIVLLILKILGIILLILLTLVLLSVFLVLFCPVTYRVRGSYHGKVLQMKARVFWLGCLLGLFVDTDGGDIQMYLRILGIRKALSKNDNLEDFEDTITDEVKKTEVAAEETVKELTETEDSHRPSEADQHLSEEAENKNSRSQDSRENDTPTKKKRISPGAILERIRQVISNLVQTLKNINATRERIVQLLQDQQCKAAFRTIWDNILYLLKKIMPRKLNLSLKYSTGSPDTTGELLGILAMFPMGYQNRWNITPDFVSEEFYAEADFDVKGHISGVWLLRALLGIVLDKNCQKLYNKIRLKHEKWEVS